MIAYGKHPLTGETIAVKSGERGYWQVSGTPEELNKAAGLSEAEAAELIRATLGVAKA